MMDPHVAHPRSPLTAQGPDVEPKTGAAMLMGVGVFVAGLILALWIVFGRFPFGVGGDLTPVYLLLGIVLVVLHAFIGQAFSRAAARGHAIRRASVITLVAAWGCGILLGLTIPDVTAEGLQTVISGTVEPWRGIAIGLANPAGIITVGLTIAALVLAHQDAKGPRPTGED